MAIPSAELMKRIASLSQDECLEIRESPVEYAEILSELLDAYGKYIRAVKTRSSLESQIASLKYRHYEQFMKVHRNAIVLSSLRSKAGIMGIYADPGKLEKVEKILQEYLMIGV